MRASIRYWSCQAAIAAAASRSSGSPAAPATWAAAAAVSSAADQVHLVVGEAVEFDEHLCGAGNGGEGGGFELALEDLVDAGGHFFDGVAQAFGYAFVGAGGG